MKQNSIPSPVDSLRYIKCSSSPVKALAILLDAIFRTSAVDQNDWKHTRNQTKTQICWGDKHAYYSQVLQKLSMRPSNLPVGLLVSTHVERCDELALTSNWET